MPGNARRTPIREPFDASSATWWGPASRWRPARRRREQGGGERHGDQDQRSFLTSTWLLRSQLYFFLRASGSQSGFTCWKS